MRPSRVILACGLAAACAAAPSATTPATTASARPPAVDPGPENAPPPGPAEIKSNIEGVPAYWSNYAGYYHKKWGDPRSPADAAYQHDRSPLYFLDRVQRPLLVVQGDRDVRVKKDQSDRVVAALQARNAAVHYVVLKDEGHGLSRTESLLTAYGTTDRFLDRYLWGDTSVEVVK